MMIFYSHKAYYKTVLLLDKGVNSIYLERIPQVATNGNVFPHNESETVVQNDLVSQFKSSSSSVLSSF